MIYELGNDGVTDLGAAFIAPSAAVIGRVTLGKDSSVWFNTVIRGDVEDIAVGARSNIQDGSVLHADAGIPLSIGSDVTVGHLVMAHGCEIGGPVPSWHRQRNLEWCPDRRRVHRWGPRPGHRRESFSGPIADRRSARQGGPGIIGARSGGP